MSLRRTPLYGWHVDRGARMVAFAGWGMPVQYDGIVAEHRACRAACGLFDVSHMGKLEIHGPGAEGLLQRACTNDFPTLASGRARYSLLCAEDGGILDDLIVYRRADDAFLLIVNAANFDADRAALERLSDNSAQLIDINEGNALLAVQGPTSGKFLASLLGADGARLLALRYYAFDTFELLGLAMTVARTGYTGDRGYELLVPAEHALPVWERLLDSGTPIGLSPVGLGARDTLRLEAGFCLHGHDIGPDRNPVEADLMRFVDLDKGPFVGREAIAEALEAGAAQRLVGIEVTGRGVIREGHEILCGDETVGQVTSGSYGPTVDRFIGLGYVSTALSEPGTDLEVVVRGRPVSARVAPRPFYRPD